MSDAHEHTFAPSHLPTKLLNAVDGLPTRSVSNLRTFVEIMAKGGDPVWERMRIELCQIDNGLLKAREYLIQIYNEENTRDD